MNKEYDKKQKKIDLKKNLRQKKPFFNCQGYNVINMKYENNLSGNILKNRDMKAEVKKFKRAENLFNRSNNDYDIFTGKDKNFRSYHQDIIDKLKI